MAWQTDEFDGEHDGRPAAVLADGSEPAPMIYDSGSGSDCHETTDWWVYDGTYRAPRATALRAACSCGWRDTADHPIAWEQVSADHPYDYDTSAPRERWQRHIADVEARTVPLPSELSELLHRVDEHLERLADDAPLALLRAAAALERTIARTAQTAAFNIKADSIPIEKVAAGLGMSDSTASSRLFRYHYAR